MHAHEAGWAHADGALQGPAWLREPADANALVPHLWSSTARKGDDGVLEVGGRGRRRPRRRARHPGVRPRRGRLPRPRPRLPRRVRRLRRLLRRQGVPLHRRRALGRRGGALPRRLLRRRADRRRCGPGSTRPGSATTATTRPCAELRRAVDRRGRPDHRRLLRRDRAARPRSPRELGRAPAAGDGAGHRRRRGAHPRVHRHRPRGPEVRLLDHRRATRCEAVRRVLAAPGLELLGLHSHIGTQIFDTSGFEVAARRVLALHAQVSEELGVDAARDGPRRRLRHRLHHPGRPVRPGAAGRPR